MASHVSSVCSVNCHTEASAKAVRHATGTGERGKCCTESVIAGRTGGPGRNARQRGAVAAQSTQMRAVNVAAAEVYACSLLIFSAVPDFCRHRCSINAHMCSVVAGHAERCPLSASAMERANQTVVVWRAHARASPRRKTLLTCQQGGNRGVRYETARSVYQRM